MWRFTNLKNGEEIKNMIRKTLNKLNVAYY